MQNDNMNIWIFVLLYCSSVSYLSFMFFTSLNIICWPTPISFYHSQFLFIPAFALWAELRANKAAVRRTTSILEEALEFLPSLFWEKKNQSFIRKAEQRHLSSLYWWPDLTEWDILHAWLLFGTLAWQDTWGGGCNTVVNATTWYLDSSVEVRQAKSRY